MWEVWAVNEDLYEFYNSNDDFRGYVDRWCQQHKLSIFEAFRLVLVQEYARDVKERSK